jgi:hypothetical protein
VVVTLSGRVDTLPDSRVELDVTSVLPAGTQPAKLPPKPAHPWVARADRSALPFAVLLPLALLAIGALHWWWRRRGPPRPAAVSPTAPALDAARLERWLAAGEPRLALEHLAWSTRGRPELDDWRARAEAERFAAGDDAGLDALVREGWARATEESP